MTCPTCQTLMILGESGWVCPKDGCPQRIVPFTAKGWGPVNNDIGHRKSPEQRGADMADAIRRME
jgi:hypothetical protein